MDKNFKTMQRYTKNKTLWGHAHKYASIGDKTTCTDKRSTVAMVGEHKLDLQYVTP